MWIALDLISLLRKTAMRFHGRGGPHVMSIHRHDSDHRVRSTSGELFSQRFARGELDVSDCENGFLSVVVPAKNESESLTRLVDEICQALRSLRVAGKDAPG